MSEAPRVSLRLVPAVIGGALFMQTLDSFIIANALPTMARSLGIDVVRMNLAITAYLLAAAIALPVSAWVADRFGAKRVFQAAILGFMLASLGCALSTDLTSLICARLAQGVAGAMMVPVGRLVLLRTVPRSELVQAMSWLTIPAVLGPIIGPPLGGFIVTFFSWRWIFLINLPIGLIGLVLTSLYIPDVREEIREPLDVRGFILTALGLAGLDFGLENLGHGLLGSTQVALLIGGGVMCLFAFALHARREPFPLLDLSLFRYRSFTAAVVGGLFGRLIQGAGPFLLALLLQVAFGLSAWTAGLISFAAAIGALLMKFIAPPAIRRFGFRSLLIGNALLVAASIAACAAFTAATPHALIFVVLLLGGFLRSLQFTALNALVYADVPEHAMSRAASLATMLQQVAASMGVAVAATLVHWSTARHLGGAITTADITPSFLVIAALSLISIAFFLAMRSDAGAEISGRR